MGETGSVSIVLYSRRSFNILPRLTTDLPLRTVLDHRNFGSVCGDLYHCGLALLVWRG